MSHYSFNEVLDLYLESTQITFSGVLKSINASLADAKLPIIDVAQPTAGLYAFRLLHQLDRARALRFLKDKTNVSYDDLELVMGYINLTLDASHIAIAPKALKIGSITSTIAPGFELKTPKDSGHIMLLDCIQHIGEMPERYSTAPIEDCYKCIQQPEPSTSKRKASDDDDDIEMQEVTTKKPRKEMEKPKEVPTGYEKYAVKQLKIFSYGEVSRAVEAALKKTDKRDLKEMGNLDYEETNMKIKAPTLMTSANKAIQMKLDTINNEAMKVHSNGKIEAGLEANQGAGLASSNYVRIPINIGLEKDLKIVDKQGNVLGSINSKDVDGGLVYNTRGEFFAKIRDKLVNVELPPRILYSPENLVRFIMANIIEAKAYVTDRGINIKNYDEAVSIFIGCRFAALIDGALVTPHNKEYTFVDAVNENEATQDAIDIALIICDKLSEYFTLIFGRGLSYKKCNHALGSPHATGLMKKLINRYDWVGDRKKKEEVFYAAVHPASPHVIITQICEEDIYSWSAFDPCFGQPTDVDVLSSLDMRTKSENSVAGTAWIADSFEVLQLLIREQISILLKNQDQIMDLNRARDAMIYFGMAAHQAANWYMMGNPFGYKAAKVDQRNGAHVALVRELARIAVVYYSQSSIAEAPALMAASKECNDSNIMATWNNIKDIKDSYDSDNVSILFLGLKSAVTSNTVSDFSSPDPNIVSAAYEKYKMAMEQQAAIVGIQAPVFKPVDEFISSMKDAKASFADLKARRIVKAPTGTAKT